MTKFIRIGIATLTTGAALMLTACPAKDAKQDVKPQTVQEQVNPLLKNTFWHKGQFFMLDSENNPTAVNIGLQTISNPGNNFSYIANDGQAAFIYTRGNIGIGTHENNAGALGMVLGKISGNKLTGTAYDFTKQGKGEATNVQGTEITFFDSAPITQEFSFAEEQTDFTKKMVNSFELFGFKFKGEAYNLDSIGAGTFKSANSSYSCTIQSDGKNLSGNAKVQEDGISIKYDFSRINLLTNDCSFEFKFENSYTEENKPLQYKVTGAITECNNPGINPGKYSEWLTASDFAGIGLAHDGNRLRAYVASPSREKAIILICN